MQTPAEKYIIETLKSYLCEHYKKDSELPIILNIGAGRNVVIENQLVNSGCTFVCDRADIDNFQISNDYMGNCHLCSVESMHPIKSREYNAAFSNYLLEHVRDLNKVASEIYRILKNRGIYVTSVPNPTAPEFILAKTDTAMVSQNS
ncbi:MAG: methyltransferase domain-containing protein [Planctomycetia bacterium]|nr:methyltransferase domain-containing protein [Planctomycetia bacterium]